MMRYCFMIRRILWKTTRESQHKTKCHIIKDPTLRVRGKTLIYSMKKNWSNQFREELTE